MKIILIVFMVHSFVWAEVKSGPHEGFVQQSGPYNIEILLKKDGSLQVYLLDADLKNPSVKNSEVGIFIKSGNTESELSCLSTAENYFECKQSGKVFHKGELSISSKREGIRSDEIKIKIPFEKN